jgi:hypothetical protein
MTLYNLIFSLLDYIKIFVKAIELFVNTVLADSGGICEPTRFVDYAIAILLLPLIVCLCLPILLIYLLFGVFAIIAGILKRGGS